MSYPLRNGDNKWTPEYRREWNKQYRQKVKSGEIIPKKRSETSRWDDPEWRKEYDKARIEKLRQDKFEEKTSFVPLENPQHYSKKEKEVILGKMLDLFKRGENFSHPHFVLAIALKDEFKCRRKKKSQDDKPTEAQN